MIRHDAAETVRFIAEIDLTGQGNWVQYQTFDVKPNQSFTHTFPQGFNASWFHLTSDKDVSSVTAALVYQ